MHINYEKQVDGYYHTVRQEVEKRLSGTGSGDSGLPYTAAFTFANPLLLAVGRHILVETRLTPNNSGVLTESHIPKTAQPFVIVFGSAAFNDKSLEDFIQELLHEKVTFSSITNTLRRRERVQDVGNIKPGIHLLGTTFGRVDIEAQIRLDQDEARRIERATKQDTLATGEEKLSEVVTHFAPYGYAAILHDKDLTRVVRFYGHKHSNDLVGDDDVAVDIHFGRKSADIVPVRKMSDVSLAKYDEAQAGVAQSAPRPFVGPMHFINDIVYLKDIKGFPYTALFDIIQEALA